MLDPDHGEEANDPPVEVGGFSLNPGIVNRTIKWTTAVKDVTIQVIWP